MSTSACPACGSPARAFVRAADVAYAYCGACAAAFWDPFPAQAQLDLIYSDARYFDRTRGGDEARPAFGNASYREEVERASVERLALLPAGTTGRLLDVGCATGEFLDIARARGFDVEGVEVSEHAARLARERLGVKVHAGTLASAGLAPASFALVTLFHVIEHLRDPAGFLRDEVAPLLASGGLVLVEVPNLDSVDFALQKEAWVPLAPGEHVWQFTRRGLAGVLARAGFEVLALVTPHGAWSLTKLLRYVGIRPGTVARWKKQSALAGEPAPSGRVASWPVEVARRLAAGLTWPIGAPLVRLIEATGRGERLLALARPGRA